MKKNACARQSRGWLSPHSYAGSMPVAVMEIQTAHFGPVAIEVNDILHFPHGVVAFEDCRHWVVLADEDNPALAWLQSVTRPEIALPVVSPRRFVPEYSVRVGRGQLLSLELSPLDGAYVLGIVSTSDGDLTLNLKAPLIINLDRRLGRQVITTDEQPVALALPQSRPAVWRKSA
jgi:flagellar assembly factor FliW